MSVATAPLFTLPRWVTDMSLGEPARLRVFAGPDDMLQFARSMSAKERAAFYMVLHNMGERWNATAIAEWERSLRDG